MRFSRLIRAALLSGALVALTLISASAPTPAHAFSPGGKSIGDSLFPQVGNKGYDARQYLIRLNYSPAKNKLLRGTRTTMKARATKALSKFSLDFQDLRVTKVMVNNRRASFSQKLAKPLFRRGGVTELRKLIVTPKSGIRDGNRFKVRIEYQGRPESIVDPDLSREGWIQACSGGVCDGAFVVNEPNGAQSWFPSNNHPADKARFRTRIKVPHNYQAFGIGELASNKRKGRKRIWTWVEPDKAATYLTTATVGKFDLSIGTFPVARGGQNVDLYTAIDRRIAGGARDSVDLILTEVPGMVNFFAGDYGPYPAGSAGAVVDDMRLTPFPYALEVQGKPHFPNPSLLNRPTLAHEVAHEWFGNSVSPADWSVIWHNEGWAQWSEWHWLHEQRGDVTTAQRFEDHYSGTSSSAWEIPPATLDGDPRNLFKFFPTYTRGAMTLEGYRQIVGNGAFFEFAQRLGTDYRYGKVRTGQIVDLALEVAETEAGFTAPQLAKLDDFFEQWLRGTTKPDHPSDFILP